MSTRRQLAVLAAAVAVSSACPADTPNEPPPPEPTTIELNQTAVDLDAIGATATLSATVKDQNGAVMSGQTVTWASANTAIAGVSGTGVVTAAGNGQTTVTATSGSLNASANVTVAQAPASITAVSGDQQTGTVGQALADPVVVEVRDRLGVAIPGGAGGALATTTVDFAVTAGGGSTSPPSATVGTDGRASTVWTLGPTAGPQALAASLLGGQVPANLTATFSGTGLAAAPDTVLAAAGDAQFGIEGATLADSLVVRVADPFGNLIQGDTVTFAVTLGTGVVSPAITTTDAGGLAKASFTLGLGTGSQQVTATVDTFNIVFSATATPAPASVSISAGNGQTATVNTAVPIAPAVLVEDAGMNPVPGIEVVFSVSGGGGSVTGDTATTDLSGIAAVGSWTLGTTAGAQELTATVTGSTPVMFDATATPDAAAALVAADGDGESGLVGADVNIPPEVRVEDQFGNPIAGVGVTFAVTGGGGTATGLAQTTAADGEADVGDWTLGPTAGANQLTVTSGALTPVVFTVTGIVAAYNIDVRPIAALTAPQQAAFDSAEAHWERIVIGDVQDIPLNLAANACTAGQPAVSETVDDLIIFANIAPIDGPGGILGGAGPCLFSQRSSNLSIIGVMTFDSDDMAALEAAGQLDEVILHEMGHVLGIGTLWPIFNLLVDPALQGGTDPHFVGPRAIDAFDDIGGTGYTGGAKVPVEGSTGQQGTDDGHWRESVLDTELMTGFLDGGVPNPLSLLTIASLLDMNYVVNYNVAEAFSISFPLRAGAPGFQLHLKGDIWRAPPLRVDENGWIVRAR